MKLTHQSEVSADNRARTEANRVAGDGVVQVAQRRVVLAVRRVRVQRADEHVPHRGVGHDTRCERLPVYGRYEFCGGIYGCDAS